MTARILVVEDEEPIAEILRFNLDREGYEVTVAHDGVAAVEMARDWQPDLIILDIMLPKLDGFSVCRQVRSESAVPILMLTAKEAEIDKVLGLELGADDYVTKPFSPREILARVRAILRRYQIASTALQTETKQVRLGDLEIDMEAYAVRRGAERLDLTPREFELLKHLATHPGQVFPREALLREVWGYDYFGDLRTVDVTVRRLREKIEVNPAEPVHVLTKRGIGYYCQR